MIFLATCVSLFFFVRYVLHGSVHHELITAVQTIPGSHQNLTNLTAEAQNNPVQSYADINDVIMDDQLDSSGVNPRVHVFYYPWYGNPEFDSVFLHWNHEYLSNWDKNDKAEYPSGRHQPPEDIGANFYPLLGCYSSNDTKTVAQHMEWIKSAGAGVLVVSWYPPEQADKQGKPFDRLFPMILDSAMNHSLKVAFHIEPYEGRTPENMKDNLEYIIGKYGGHPATYRLSKSPGSTKALPVFYIYDSYLSSSRSWSALLGRSGKHSIRNTELDGIFLGLVVELRHK